MKTLYTTLLIFIATAFAGTINAQNIENQYSEEEKTILQNMTDSRVDFTKPMPSDSLKKVYKLIDKMSHRELMIVREAYVYKIRRASNKQNDDILNRINKTIEKNQ